MICEFDNKLLALIGMKDMLLAKMIFCYQVLLLTITWQEYLFLLKYNSMVVEHDITKHVSHSD
jgi:hypothetical protein